MVKDWRYFMGPVCLLMLIGIIMVYSSSYLYAKELYGPPWYFLSRQVVFVFLGLSLVAIMGKFPFSSFEKTLWWLQGTFILLLILTFVPGIGKTIKGASRWISVMGMTFQPGEFVKYLLPFFVLNTAPNFAKYEKKKKILSLLLLLTPLFLLLRQPDYGAFSICLISLVFLAFLSPLSTKTFFSIAAGGLVIILIPIFTRWYRVVRVLSYLDPWKDPRSSGFQIIQSYLAFANGKVFGRGIGNSHEKLLYLPEAYNDFILSVVGEEFGLLGVGVLIFLFLMFIYLGLRIALKLTNQKEILLGATLVTIIGIQVVLNMGVVLGLLPTKGLNLPFISYGGSSLLANCFALGLLNSLVKTSSIRPQY